MCLKHKFKECESVNQHEKNIKGWVNLCSFAQYRNVQQIN